MILKRKDFSGISYLSTKKFKDVKIDVEDKDAFKENIAIFTNLTLDHVYDKELFETISMSVPIDVNKIDAITIDDLKEITTEIALSKNQEKISHSEVIFSYFNRIYGNMKIDEKEYYNTEYGKLHLYQLYTILNEILVE